MRERNYRERSYADGTPSADCLAAALRLRELADAATDGPWDCMYDGGLLSVIGTEPLRSGGYPSIALDFTQADADWIVLFGPDTASFWVPWLHEEADRLRWCETDWTDVAECGVRHLVHRVLRRRDPGPSGRYREST